MQVESVLDWSTKLDLEKLLKIDLEQVKNRNEVVNAVKRAIAKSK